MLVTLVGIDPRPAGCEVGELPLGHTVSPLTACPITKYQTVDYSIGFNASSLVGIDPRPAVCEAGDVPLGHTVSPLTACPITKYQTVDYSIDFNASSLVGIDPRPAVCEAGDVPLGHTVSPLIMLDSLRLAPVANGLVGTGFMSWYQLQPTFCLTLAPMAQWLCHRLMGW